MQKFGVAINIQFAMPANNVWYIQYIFIKCQESEPFKYRSEILKHLKLAHDFPPNKKIKKIEIFKSHPDDLQP